MPATAREIGRRGFLLALAAATRLRADASADVFQVFLNLASALSEGNPVDFMKYFDKAMPQYDLLRSYATALCDQSDVSCSVAVAEESGDERARTVALDWILQIVSKQAAGGLTRRHQTVTCEVRKDGKRWKIVSLSPVQFFAPLRPE